EPVYLDLSVEADEAKRYKVGVGDYSEEFTGEGLDNLVAGPINLPENEVVQIDITLADPSHKNEEMEMTFSSAYLAPISSSSSLKKIINYYEENGLENEEAHAIRMHLNAIERFEETEASDKVVKHLKGLNELLDHYKEQELISEKAYDALKVSAESLNDKWE